MNIQTDTMRSYEEATPHRGGGVARDNRVPSDLNTSASLVDGLSQQEAPAVSLVSLETLSPDDVSAMIAAARQVRAEEDEMVGRLVGLGCWPASSFAFPVVFPVQRSVRAARSRSMEHCSGSRVGMVVVGGLVVGLAGG